MLNIMVFAQATSLTPLLFLIFINDVIDGVTVIVLLADDMKLYRIIRYRVRGIELGTPSAIC